MTTLVPETEPLATAVVIDYEKLVVELADGRSLAIPLDWYPRLMHGSSQERNDWQLLSDGYAIEWPQLDEHIGTKGLLAGRPSSESQRSLAQWLAARQA
ncbi:DUF2442 domain-containing protein [Nodosilinea sp. FACHB-13]|uniref:DUF2442 domain-containing protein n=1 Tax=Cyanophyceae TaxID=3028117 RepID=UPI001682B2FC|nr:DUF2442 domain-containing protein [Nodosilinea sp. FACHB-13]MBD2105989.1 DUF2442 domain-containing protein [Nodosilinea sp. FACHB-13]